MARKIRFISFLSTVVFIVPFLVAAATIQSVIVTAHRAVNFLTPLVMTIGIAVFLYGVVKYMLAAGDREKIKDAKGYIIYGILGLFVMVAFWGLVTVIVTTFNLGAESKTIVLPPAPHI